MEEENKLPLKRVELSLIKFNEVAIPHHLDLLRQHKANIIKLEAEGALAAARGEQRAARRVAAQLRALLQEMDALRRQVREQDRARFDALTQRSRDNTLRAIVDYLGVIESSCRALVRLSPRRSTAAGSSPVAIGERAPTGEGAAASVASSESVGVVAPLDQIQLQVDDQELALRSREELLVGWSELQGEVRALHDVWQRAQAAALHQRALTARADDTVERAAEDVAVARTHLAASERLSAGLYGGAGGALAGAMLGGPVGMLVGAKAGALAAAAGSLLGYVAVRVWRPFSPAPTPSPSTSPTPAHKEERKDV